MQPFCVEKLLKKNAELGVTNFLLAVFISLLGTTLKTKIKIAIMEKSKIEIMEDFQQKLEDIVNSQESLAEKIGHVQVDLFNAPDKELEKAMEDFATRASADYAIMSEVLEDYKMRVNNEKNNAPAPKAAVA
jgi:hypothetical protein